MSQSENREMTAADVLSLIKTFSDKHVEVWLDGGWGVDALLGQQTRKHGDVDIVVRHDDLPRLDTILANQGYSKVQDGARDWNYVMADHSGHEVDIHTVVFDFERNGLYGPQDNGESMYPADSFNGKGSINGEPVKCLTADFQVDSHTGYQLYENDYHDVLLLHEKFNIQLPPAYKNISKHS